MNPPLAHPSRRRPVAFTLVELLVVIAVVSVLIAILLPAVSRAKFRSQIVRCLANERGLATAVLSYSNENRTWYPYRQVAFASGGPQFVIKDGLSATTSDDRAMFSSFLNTDVQLTCPLSPLAAGISYSRNAVQTLVGYELWFGSLIDASQPLSAMRRAGDRPVYRTGGVSRTFNVLAADAERDWDGSSGNYNIFSSHPDETRSLSRFELYDASYTFSSWRSTFASAAAMKRGPVERNFIFDDGSGKTRRLVFRDPSLTRVPFSPDNPSLPSVYLWLPAMQ